MPERPVSTVLRPSPRPGIPWLHPRRAVSSPNPRALDNRSYGVSPPNSAAGLGGRVTSGAGGQGSGETNLGAGDAEELRAGGQPLTARDAGGQGSGGREPPSSPLPSPASHLSPPGCTPTITPPHPAFPAPSPLSPSMDSWNLFPRPTASNYFFLNHEILPSTYIFQDKGRPTVRRKPCNLGEKKGS